MGQLRISNIYNKFIMNIRTEREPMNCIAVRVLYTHRTIDSKKSKEARFASIAPPEGMRLLEARNLIAQARGYHIFNLFYQHILYFF